MQWGIVLGFVVVNSAGFGWMLPRYISRGNAMDGVAAALNLAAVITNVAWLANH